MVSVSVLVSIPILISDLICPGRDRDQLRVRLIAGTFVVCGIGTILQSGFGLRLALLQGVAFAYIPSVRAFMSLPEYKCLASVDDFVPPEVYENKMAMIQGTLMASSCVTMLIGATGLVGIMTKYIGPMTVSPLLMLMMLSSVKITVERVEKHWISLVMAASLFATVLYLSRLQVPFPGYSKGKFRLYRLNVFGQFPERPPPSHALNRGIMAEGLGCFISGLIGPGVGITTHAENVGVIGITRVASRVTMIFGGCTLIAFGVVTKLGAILSAIPDPLVGVVLSTSMAMVGGVAIANVQTVDLKLTRNVAILGFSIMLGVVNVYLYPNKFQQIIDSFPILRYLPFIPKRKYVKEDNKNNEKQRNGVKIVPNENFV
uniref:Uncharacterized protein n=1 Tax=Meloidogyne javanica TaxID=6303 RepID=A0A915MEI8_MELJA